MGLELIEDRSPIQLLKAVKSPGELASMRDCHLRDSAALCRFFAWLDNAMVGGSPVDEVSAAEKLEEFRSADPRWKGPSFPTISSAGANAAVIHYHPSDNPRTKLSLDQIYLCDSGAHYLDGTTDVTRTFWFGTAPDSEATRVSTAPAWIRRCYTKVLAAHIALDSAVFPAGTPGQKLDTIARAPLWAAGLDYKHGTGHGVGFFLNVHEGPQAISFRPNPAPQPMLAGMVTSNEPGYYEDGAFGIRIENVIECVPADLGSDTTASAPMTAVTEFLAHKSLTYVPMCSLLVDPAVLGAEGVAWLDCYHKQCREAMAPLLQAPEDEMALRWLMRETVPVGENETLYRKQWAWTAKDATGVGWAVPLTELLV